MSRSISTGSGENQTAHPRMHPVPHEKDFHQEREDPDNDACLVSIQTKHVEGSFWKGNIITANSKS